jgi:hypothetical protein
MELLIYPLSKLKTLKESKIQLSTNLKAQFIHSKKESTHTFQYPSFQKFTLRFSEIKKFLSQKQTLKNMLLKLMERLTSQSLMELTNKL